MGSPEHSLARHTCQACGADEEHIAVDLDRVRDELAGNVYDLAYLPGPLHDDEPSSAVLRHRQVSIRAEPESVRSNIVEGRAELPEEPTARVVEPEPSCVTDPILQFDLRDAGIATIVWATGFAFDFGWLQAGAFDARGAPVHRRGITAVPGLYVLGLPFLSVQR
jgi:hypothetical protein